MAQNMLALNKREWCTAHIYIQTAVWRTGVLL